MVKPDFFIVGAPKCGTTAMCRYLDMHPEIFLSPIKELCYFAKDLNLKRQAQNLEEYLGFFAEGEGYFCGEGTPLYLYSKTAAQEIHAFNPEAKIIIMLREPVSLMYSYYSQHLYDGSSEDIQDFKEALDAEPERKLGKRIPLKCRYPEKLFYRELVKFSEQIERYFDAFGREGVHIIIFDDFKSDLAKVYRETLEFLGVNPNFEIEFNAINSNKKVRSVFLQQFLKYPPSRLLEIGKFFVPLPRSVRRALLERVKQTLKGFNTEYKPRPPLDAELRRHLQQELAPEVEKLSALLGRDLTYWSEG